MSIILGSYNIHRCYGRDGRYDPARIRQVLRQLGTQVIALQEVELLYDSPGLLDFFCEDSSWRSIPGLTLTRTAGEYGNALLTSLPVHSVRRIDLSQPGFEPRGALQVVLEGHDRRLNVLATHLGLRAGERIAQVKRLLDAITQVGISSNNADVTVLMGDLNDWLPWARARRLLHHHFEVQRAPATYPAGFPLFSLDRILVNPFASLRDVEVINNDLTRIASDHLPLIGKLDTTVSSPS
ncbi:MAG: endonuclease/exonuclease/phosphatase family protein [Burkholderiales bacterium]